MSAAHRAGRRLRPRAPKYCTHGNEQSTPETRAEPSIDTKRTTPKRASLTPAIFDAAFEIYYRRGGDKGYSPADCMSMHIRRDMGVEDVLTHDRCFAHEGLTALL